MIPSAQTSAPIAIGNFRAQLQVLVETNARWIEAHWLEIAIAILCGAALVIGAHAVRRYAVQRAAAPTLAGSWPAIIGNAIGRTTNFFLVSAAAKLVDGYARAPAEITAGINFPFVIAAGLQAAIWAREIILGLIEQRAHRNDYANETIINALGIIRLLVSVSLFTVAAIVILGNLGVNISGLIAGLGVGGIAVGLAAQGIFADLFAALAIIFDRPFSKGDAISYDNTNGTVEEIGLKSTRIRSVTGEERVIANKQLLDKEIQNNSRRSRRRVAFKIGTIYQTAPDVALAIPGILRGIVESAGAVFVRSGFVGFGDSSLDFEVEFDCSADYEECYQRRHEIGLAILRRFNADGIEFAYPTQTTFTADPDGTMILPYPEVQPVKRVDPKAGEG